ncbi:hypothetical protein [Mongoliitalea lutea]
MVLSYLKDLEQFPRFVRQHLNSIESSCTCH